MTIGFRKLARMVPHGLCVGLDPILDRIHPSLRSSDEGETITRFLEAIIDATRPFAAAYKVNTAFFEQYGLSGIRALYAVREHIADSFCIIDAKRGDIANTSSAYARALFDDLHADAVTVAPYMGSDSVEPFLAYEGKLVYVLGLTSNPGSADFQRLDIHGRPLYQHVMHTALGWKGAAARGFVVGATHPAELEDLRTTFPEIPFLIPGIGSQGGDTDTIARANGNGPALFNSSRGILYAGDGDDFAQKAADVARRVSSLTRRDTRRQS